MQEKVSISPTPKKRLSLEDAIKNGDAVLRSSVDDMVKEEMDKRIASIKEELRTEIVKENALKKLDGAKRGIQSYLVESGLGNEELAMRLLQLNITANMAKHLRDEHMRLTDSQLWDTIRNSISRENLLVRSSLKNTSTIGG